MLQRSPCLNSCWLRCDGACAAKNGLTIYSAANIVYRVNPIDVTMQMQTIQGKCNIS